MTPTIVPFLPILCQLGSIVIMWIINVCSVFIVVFYCFTKNKTKAITCQDQIPRKCVYSLEAE